MFCSDHFRKFVEPRSNLGLRILRIYSSAVEKKDYPGPDLRTQMPPDVTCPDWAKPYALHHLVREKSSSPKLAEMEEKLKEMKREGKIASGMFCTEYRDALKAAYEDFLEKEKFDVVLCTCNEASGGRVRKNLSVHQCIIDECGMAYEPETIVPLGLCKHAVLIGDHMQLQPVISYQPARENGLVTSLFERYAQHYRDEYLITLTTQYRMVRAFTSSVHYRVLCFILV